MILAMTTLKTRAPPTGSSMLVKLGRCGGSPCPAENGRSDFLRAPYRSDMANRTHSAAALVPLP